MSCMLAESVMEVRESKVVVVGDWPVGEDFFLLSAAVKLWKLPHLVPYSIG